MGRSAEVREAYECSVCGYKMEVFVPVLEAICPNTHTIKSGSRTRMGKVAMTKTFDRKGASR